MTKEELIKEAVYTAPLSLLGFKNQEDINTINDYLPYSTGFEIECGHKDTFKSIFFKDIPNIIEVNCSELEQRFRIPNGINGLLCLYFISEKLVQYCELNLGSGIHYHIDCTDVNWIAIMQSAVNSEKYILQELDAWEYKGHYNNKAVDVGHSWVRLSGEFYTLEFRIGEMTFDYSLLVKRIIHANNIVRKLKENLETKPTEYLPLDYGRVLTYIKNNISPSKVTLKQLKREINTVFPVNEGQKLEVNTNEANNVIKNRIVRI